MTGVRFLYKVTQVVEVVEDVYINVLSTLLLAVAVFVGGTVGTNVPGYVTIIYSPQQSH